MSLQLEAGPQYSSGRDTISLSAGPQWRWYGGGLYTVGYGVSAGLRHPTGDRALVRLDGSVTHQDNRRNALQTSDDFTLSAGLDRALSARFGAGGQVFAYRSAARDPGYSLASGGLSLYAYREAGRTTLVANAGYSHLEADRRLFLYPRRRIENRFSASVAGTFRALTLGTFAPIVRLTWERNRSSIEIYDYARLAAEFGVTTAF